MLFSVGLAIRSRAFVIKEIVLHNVSSVANPKLFIPDPALSLTLIAPAGVHKGHTFF